MTLTGSSPNLKERDWINNDVQEHCLDRDELEN